MKKLTLVLLALAVLLALSGCACKHEETKLVNAAAATCTADGYTGDTVCVKCEETVTKGEAIAAKGHGEGEAKNAAAADCETEGYTGDVYCAVCDELLTKGEKIPMAEHVAGDALKAKEATCEKDGYTGDVHCLACGLLLEEGEVIPATGHTPGEATGAVEATCTKKGYTGDIYCTVCDKIVEKGAEIDTLAHTPGEPTGVVEPTCLQAGYTGDHTCTVCEAEIKGDVIAKLDHPYADGVCPDCGWRESGLYILGERMYTWQELVDDGFFYLTNDNTTLYNLQKDMSGELVIDESIVKIENGAMTACTLNSIWIPVTCTDLGDSFAQYSENLQEVVIYAPVETLLGSFNNCTQLERVVLPDTLNAIENMTFNACEALKEIAIPDGVTSIGYKAFQFCTSLEGVTLPSALTTIGQEAFYGCTALTSIELPAGVEAIEAYAFYECASLTELALPEGLIEFGSHALYGTGVEELILPASLKMLGAFDGNETIRRVDMSKTAVEKFTSAMFSGCTALEEVLLPEQITSFDSYAFSQCASLKKLVLPERLMNIEDDYFAECESLTTIVWPVTLTDGSAFAELPSLTEIYYRGSEEQWNKTSMKDLFPNAAITFNYTGE